MRRKKQAKIHHFDKKETPKTKIEQERKKTESKLIEQLVRCMSLVELYRFRR